MLDIEELHLWLAKKRNFYELSKYIFLRNCSHSGLKMSEHHGGLRPKISIFRQRKKALNSEATSLMEATSRINFSDLQLEAKAFCRGGNGVIYRGVFGDVPVAAKSTYASMFSSDHEELNSEFEVLSRLRHPNIVRVFGSAVDEVDGRIFIVTEFCPGGDLTGIVTRDNLAFTPAHLTGILTQIFSAVRYMHAVGVVHLDLKLSNVLLAADGSVRICDMGGSSLHREDGLEPSLAGTPYYMPPEAFNTAARDDAYGI